MFTFGLLWKKLMHGIARAPQWLPCHLAMWHKENKSESVTVPITRANRNLNKKKNLQNNPSTDLKPHQTMKQYSHSNSEETKNSRKTELNLEHSERWNCTLGFYVYLNLPFFLLLLDFGFSFAVWDCVRHINSLWNIEWIVTVAEKS